MHNNVQKIRQDIMYRTIEESKQKKAKDMKKLKKFSIEKMIDKMGRNSKLLWSNIISQFKTTRLNLGYLT